MKIQYQMKSLVGPLYLVASPKGLVSIFWDKQDVPLVKLLNNSNPAQRILKNTVDQLNEYFDSRRTAFDLPLDLSGTDFQKRVWQQLTKIPFGKTVSYQDIAKRINNPKAVRAVGSANGKNPICIVVPCHRVINANGAMGGYSAGIEKKEKLLALEAVG